MTMRSTLLGLAQQVKSFVGKTVLVITGDQPTAVAVTGSIESMSAVSGGLVDSTAASQGIMDSGAVAAQSNFNI